MSYFESLQPQSWSRMALLLRERSVRETSTFLVSDFPATYLLRVLSSRTGCCEAAGPAV